MIEEQRWNKACIIVSVAMALQIIVCTFYEFGSQFDLSENEALNMTLHYTGMIVCEIVFISVLLDQRHSDATHYFMVMLALTFFCMFIEFVSWCGKASGLNDAVHEAICYLINMCFPLLLFFFGQYEKIILKVPAKTYRMICIHLDAFIVLEAALLVANVFTHFMFSYEDGEYLGTNLAFLELIAPFAMIIMCSELAIRYSPDFRHRAILNVYLLIPVLSIVVRLPDYSSSITYLATLLSMVFMYGEIYLNRGLRIAKNEAAMTEQKVAMMVTRIEPSLLSDTLDSIASLDGTPTETKTAIENFKTYLTENIDTISQKTPIPMSKELEHVRTYVNLEKLRFKEKLNVEFEVEDVEFYVPAMTLQMLVENAIKHGITQKDEGGTVTVSIEDRGDCYRILVGDDGVGFDVNAPRDTSRSHIGLANLTDRLEKMVDGTLEIGSDIGVGTVAVVTIPKKK